MTICLTCKKETTNPKFCSMSCSASYNNRIYKKRKRETLFCLNCGAALTTQFKFCKPSCQATYAKNRKVKRFLETREGSGKFTGELRKYLMERAGNKCSKCGWNKRNPYSGTLFLEFHHIDGNRKNNLEENLEVLCPNCHSLTVNYRFLNRGKRRRSGKEI